MPRAEPSDQHIFPAAGARPSRERQVTCRRAWRQGLPSAPVAANDSEPPVGRTAPARRSLTIEALLIWTYLQQQAHRILRTEIDWFLWAADAADYLTNPADRRQVHHDAATVHEAVLGLGPEIAAMVIEAAVFGDWPEWMDEDECRFVSDEPRDKYDDFGWATRDDGTQFKYRKATAEIVSIPRDEWEQVGRKKMRRAGSPSWERVPVDYCSGHWNPEPEFVRANNRLVAIWQTARPALMQALRDEMGEARFLNHVLTEDPAPLAVAVAANDNERRAANDNEPAQIERTA